MIHQNLSGIPGRRNTLALPNKQKQEIRWDTNVRTGPAQHKQGSMGYESLHHTTRRELTYYLTIAITKLPMAATNRFCTFKAGCVGQGSTQKEDNGG